MTFDLFKAIQTATEQWKMAHPINAAAQIPATAGGSVSQSAMSERSGSASAAPLLTPQQIARFWLLVEKTNGCWEWKGTKNKKGYGFFHPVRRKAALRAHRVSYRLLKGEIPEGLSLDHLCRNRACVNPDHLEPVTSVENVKRGGNTTKTHCLYGHEFSGQNTHINPKGHRVCKACWKRRKEIYKKVTQT